MDKKLNILINRIRSLHTEAEYGIMRLTHEEIKHLEYLADKIGKNTDLKINIQAINRWVEFTKKLINKEKENLTDDFYLEQLESFVDMADHRMLEILIEIEAESSHFHIG